MPALPQALCDMRDDGGWTVIQSRDWGRPRRLDFERSWQEYKQGFGDLRGRGAVCLRPAPRGLVFGAPWARRAELAGGGWGWLSRSTSAWAPPAGDHWLGLEHISHLTSQPGLRSELVVGLGVDNHTLQGHYDNFHVDGEDLFYRLTLGLYSGNTGECPGGRGALCPPPECPALPTGLSGLGGGVSLPWGQGG